MLALNRLVQAAIHGRRYELQTHPYLLGVARVWRAMIDAVGPIALIAR